MSCAASLSRLSAQAKTRSTEQVRDWRDELDRAQQPLRGRHHRGQLDAS